MEANITSAGLLPGLLPDLLPEEKIAQVMRIIGQPSRIRILLAIGKREVCVCHLESVLGQRQALISQHLMQLREAGIVIGERKSRNIYYRIPEPDLIDLVRSTAVLVGESDWIDISLSSAPVPGCPCPECSSSPICERPTQTSSLPSGVSLLENDPSSVPDH